MLELLTADYTFVNERLAKPLRHPERLRQRVPPRHAYRREPPRPARAGEHPDGDVARRPHVAGRPRQVDSREHARHAAAAAAAQRAGAQGERRPAARRCRCASGWNSIAPIRCVRAATRGWTRSASRSRTSMPSAAGAAARRRHSRSMRPARCPTARSSTARPGCAAAAGAEPEQFVDGGDRKAADLCARPRPRVLRCARGSAHRARGRASDYVSPSLIVGVVNSAPFQMRSQRPRPASTKRRPTGSSARRDARDSVTERYR